MGRSLRGWLFIGLLLAFGSLCADCQESPQSEPLTVAVVGFPPFVIHAGQTESGISVDVWEALASDLDLHFKFVRYETVNSALEAVATGEVDVAIGPISITSERATKVAFTHSYYDSSLAILSSLRPVPASERYRFILKRGLIALGVLLAVLFLVGTLSWIAERRANPAHFPEKALAGIGNGIWMALVTLTTVGYGDRAPRTPAGRLLMGLWMLVTTLTISSFTAWVASTLTISKLEGPELSHPSKLRGRRVAVVDGTTSQTLARHYTTRVLVADHYSTAIQHLQDGEADAVVFDHPILSYHLEQNPSLALHLARTPLALQDYGFALDLDDPLRDRLNVGLLRLIESGVIRDINERWLGAVDTTDP